jgi:predicted alpha/beta-hydrolase family hydrolase
VLECEYRGPKRGADRAVLLAHGAGSDMHAPALVTVAEALARAKVPSLTFDFPYRSAGRRAPDRAPVLLRSVRDAAGELAKRAKLPLDRLVLGGRSMGGRMCSMAAAGEDDADGSEPLPALGLVLLGYPLHPPGKPERLRVEHFERIHCPTLFVSGTRDPFGTPDEIRRHARRLQGRVKYWWVETGDHGFKPLKASGLTQSDVFASVAAAVVDWVLALP